MDLTEAENLPDEMDLAIAYTPVVLRRRMAAFLALDQRLARIVAVTTEPMLAQIRIAWWRDTLGQPIAKRPQGDVVLDAIGQEWVGGEHALVALADGWECVLAEPPLSDSTLERFVTARAAPFLALNSLEKDSELFRDVNQAARIWAVADLVTNTSDPEERTMFIDKALQETPSPRRLPASWRGLAILRALAMRSLRSGGQPLMAGRGAGWTALRTGLLGR